MKVRWLRKALRNLETSHEYIRQDNPEAAQRIVTQIRARVNHLAEFPLDNNFPN